MKKIIFTLLVLFTSIYASVTNEYPSKKILDSNIPIVDIRTTGEWVETGLLKGAIPIMFFNERGGYDVQGFLNELNRKVDTKKPFAIICRTGSRTRMLSQFLSKDMGYDVINLSGGMVYAKTKKLAILPYK
ncbi:MAG: rhodanese-like domain-containing protein [Campylobacterota bacterium]|nr:rhodanese-like domain-containing protein [Campylobacterota bacterium]